MHLLVLLIPGELLKQARANSRFVSLESSQVVLRLQMLEQGVIGYSFPDQEGRAIIEARRPVVCAHLTHWQSMPVACTLTIAPEKQNWLLELEQAVCRTSASGFDERSRGREEWLKVFLLPLARDLGLVQVAETTTLEQLYRTGGFDRFDPELKKLQRPAADKVIPEICCLLQTLPFHKRRVIALVEQGLCRDEESAQRVVEAWRRCEQQAGALARGIALAYLAYRDMGLLVNSSFPYTDTLLLLETQRELITDFSVQAVLPQLQADIIALARSWPATKAGTWCLRLLQEPENSEYRKRIGRSFGAYQRNSAVEALVSQHDYTEPDARALVEHILHGGLRYLLVYRTDSGNHSVAVERYEQLRVQQVLRKEYGALSEDDQAAIERLVFNLQVAIRISGVQFPLVALLKERPSSTRRIHVSRRFRFGLAAIIKRRNQRRSQRKTTLYQTSRESGRQPTPASQLIYTFAGLSKLEENEAAAVLRDLITYGAVGLLPRWKRLSCLDPRLLSWLRLIKYGRLDGRVPWSRLMVQLDIYRKALGLPKPISALLARAIVNAIPRPSFWHGGQGEATVRLRQRGSLIIGGAPRLHERWLVISTTWPIALCDTVGQSMGSSSHLVLVIEANSLLPLAVWPSAVSPTIRDVCLALYQAIWHPGAENWPVKGVPEQLIVSSELMVGECDDLDRAVDCLLCDLLVQPRIKLVSPELRTLLRKFEREGIEGAVRHLAFNERTPSQVMRSLEQWIKEEFFPYHRASPVWPEIAQHGVVMPGSDTPAAGWLLPSIGEARISADSLEHEGRYYRKPLDATLLEGGAYIRHFPALTVGGEEHRIINGVFVQPLRNKGTGPTLQYVTERR